VNLVPWFLVVLALALPVPSARAQEVSPASVEEVGSVVPPFVLADVGEQVAATTRRIEERVELAKEDLGLETTRRKVAAIGREVEEGSNTDALVLAGTVTLDQLADMQSVWGVRSRQLKELASAVGSRSNAITIAREDLLLLRRRWQATQQLALEKEEPPATLEQIATSIEAVKQARAVLGERRNELSILQGQITLADQAAAGALQAVVNRRLELRAALFQRDSPAIWSLFAGNGPGEELPARVRAAVARYLETLHGFLGSRGQELWKLLAAFVLVLFFMRAQRSKKPETESREASRVGGALLTERPFSTATVFGLLAAPLLIPDMPRAVQHTIGLILVFPLLRVLHLLLSARFRGALAALAIFYVVDRLRAVLTEAVVLERLVFVTELAFAIVASLWLFMIMERVGNSGSRVLRTGARALLVGFGLSFAANALGYDLLSRLVGEGCLNSVFAAVAAYSALAVSRTVVQAAMQSEAAQRLGAVAKRGVDVERSVLRVMAWGIALAWIWVALGAFGLRDSAVAVFRASLAAGITFGEVSVTLGAVVAFGVTLYVAILLSRFIRFVLEVDVYPRLSLDRGIPHALSATIHYLALLIGFYLALAAAGIDLSRLTLIIGALGVGIGFGLQNVVNNFVSGLILLFERPVQIGDAVEVGSVFGEVKRIGIRSSTVRSYQGAEVIVPNADLISNQVTNWTLSDRRRRVEIKVGVAYGSDAKKVREVLLGVAERQSGLLTQPAPQALFRRFDDSALAFELRVWIVDFDRWLAIENELNCAVASALTDAGIQIPFPQRDLHLRSVDVTAAEHLAGTEDRTEGR
jgi:small-conductance mechanosensitive channel